MMFPSIYEELNMDRYAELAADALSHQHFYMALYDDDQVIWSNVDTNTEDENTSSKYISSCQVNNIDDGESKVCHCSIKTSEAESTTCFNLGLLAGKSAGRLVFCRPGDEAGNREFSESALSALRNIAEIVKAELGYLYEVNAMATELGERYDELSMLRASDVALEEYRESRHIFSTYIRCCAEHLNVDYAAIWISARHEIYPGGVEYKHESNDILKMLEQLSVAAFEKFKDGHDGFGINDKDEELRIDLHLPADKKVLLVPVLDASGKPCGVLSCLNEFYSRDFNNSDKSTLEAVSRKTYKYILSTQDELTGLLNRQGFEESVWRDVSQTDCQQFLVLFNINQFKVINAAYGTATGDRVLSLLAEVISDPVNGLKYVARLEKDLFAALIETTNDDVGNQVNNICNDIDAKAISVNGKQISVVSRAGVIAVNSKETAFSDHLYAAEQALISAKEDAEQVVVYKPGNTALLKRTHQLTQVEKIKNALEEDRFELHCQRIQPMSGDELHYEILVRMVDESGALVPPDDFIPVAERFDLMCMLDRWIIEHTFMLLSRDEYRDVSANCKWGINLSGMTIGEDDIHDFVSTCLKKYQIPPTNIYFEITETAAIKNFQNCATFMNNIHSIGVQFALDDFGSGLSSFSYLKKLSIDYLKIDGSLVKDIVSSRLDQTMVAAIANIANVLNVKTIAEYVENDSILKVLHDMNIDYAQGYGIMKPQPLELELQNMTACAQNKISSNG